MSRFMNLLDGDKIDIKEEKVKSEGRLGVNFKEILSAAFIDILEKKSSLFRSMVEKGVIINFEKSFEFPKESISGKIPELINDFKKDMK